MAYKPKTMEVPTLVPLHKWRMHLKQHLAQKSAENLTFHKWQACSKKPETEFIERIYRKTHYAMKGDREVHHEAIASLRNLREPVAQALDAIGKLNTHLESTDGKIRFRHYQLRRWLVVLDKWAALLVDNKRGILARNNMRTPDPLTYCLELIAEQQKCKISESKAVALCKVFMLAHGFRDGQLTSLSEAAVDNKVVFRAVKKWLKANDAAKRGAEFH